MSLFKKIKKWLKISAAVPETNSSVVATKEFSYSQDFSYAPGRHIQQFTNKTGKSMEIWVEMNPDLYILNPDDELTIIYDQDPNWMGLGLSTFVYEGSIQIYLQEFDSCIVMINGEKVQPSNTANDMSVIIADDKSFPS
ncbi:hypothetical protein [Asticcacaulis machinosus]|uniref:Uncharacterized protein n=1 Tax=Asticcacaulis machinosus TaxID=2984211 RepID=A0ABT5HM06_9CAUL|nr:hypothetical protein [Asticcacaulis machinosus]MDC7677279.1 hypothetical protein [Asticcacaulis machinosus]